MTVTGGSSLLNLLLFSVGGVFFALDADQVAGISAYSGEQGEDLFWFHQELGYGQKTVKYSSPTIVTIRTGGLPYRVIIDSLEGFVEINANDLELMPPLLEPFALRRGIWGGLPHHGHLILLLDFKRLLAERRAALVGATN